MGTPPEPLGELRRRLRERRRSVDPDSARDAAVAAAEHLLGLPEVLAAETISVYLADDGELDPGHAVELLGERNTTMCAPRFANDEMEFGLYEGAARTGRFGIREPLGEPVPVEKIDVVVMPLVAVDMRGTRLGRGRGYYDRALGGAGRGPEQSQAQTLVGFAYDLQMVATLERKPRDVRLDVLVTPTRVVRFTN